MLKKILLFTILSLTAFAQNGITSITQKNNSFEISLDYLKTQEAFTINEGTISFLNLQDESKPGAPILPSKTYFVAIPPNSTVKASLIDPKITEYANTKPQVNEKSEITSNKSLSLVPVPLDKKYFVVDTYPSEQVKVVGYTRIANYYCAIVQVNTWQYNWKYNKTYNITNSKLKIDYTNNKYFNRNTDPLSIFERNLNTVICNLEYAKDFRFKPEKSSNDSLSSWIDYSKEYVKLNIVKDGIYRITYNDLVNYGISPSSISPTSLKLFYYGKEEPIYVKTLTPGVFGASDYIEFWGHKNYNLNPNYRTIVPNGSDYINYMDIYTDTSSYWLDWQGSNGLRAAEINSTIPSSSDTIFSGLCKTHLESDNGTFSYYDVDQPIMNLPYYQETKFNAWREIGVGTTNIAFLADKIVPNSLVKTIVRVQGAAGSVDYNTYKTSVTFGNAPIRDTVVYDKRTTQNLSRSALSSYLVEGSNNIIISHYQTSSNPNSIRLDWVDIDYYRFNSLIDDTLKIVIPDSITSSYRAVKVLNANSTDAYYVYKVSPNFRKINNGTVYGTTSKYLVFADTVKGGDVYWVIKAANFKSPTFVYKKQFTNLRNNNKSADYVIVTNKLFSNSVNQYKSFLAQHYNVKVEVAYIDDIFDEFGFGMLNSPSVKSFIKYAYDNWTSPQLSYLLFIGDANYDYKYQLQNSSAKPNYVTTFGLPVSDVYFTVFDLLPYEIQQLYVGRISASNDAEVLRYLNRHQTYVNRGFDIWNKSSIFFSSGDQNNPNLLRQFKSGNDTVYKYTILPKPVGGISTHFYKTTNPFSNLGPFTLDQIHEVLNRSGLFYSYLGHSGTETWDNGITNVLDLKNPYTDRFPLITDFGCSTGRFAEFNIDCFAEQFTSKNADGQAINYLANSSYGFASSTMRFSKYFYECYFKDTIKEVGEAHFLGKMKQFQDFGINDVTRAFNLCNSLFGDPIISLPIPQKANFHIEDSFIFSIGNWNDLDDSIDVKLIVQNLGKVTNDTLKIKITDSQRDSIIYSQVLKITDLLNIDTLSIKIPIKGLVGAHKIHVKLDFLNQVDEIYENDNDADYIFYVFATSIKPVVSERNNSAINRIKLLNPIYKLSNRQVYNIQIADNLNFTNPITLTPSFDSVSTLFNLPQLSLNKRYFLKSKIDETSFNYSEPISFVKTNNPYNYYVDSLANFNEFNFVQAGFDSLSKSFTIANGLHRLKITSAGANDGKFASIKYDGLEKMSQNFFWGIGAMDIDSITLEPSNCRLYSDYEGRINPDSLISYINNMPSGKMIALLVSDDALQSCLWGHPTLRTVIKTLGSLLIDSLSFRESWCIIGKKGAAIGSIPEVYHKQTLGAAIIDTSVVVKLTNGSIKFPVAHNAGKWSSIIVRDTLLVQTSITYYLYGIKQDGSQDSLGILTMNNRMADISNVNAKLYPNLRLAANLNTQNVLLVPKIFSAAFDFNILPELSTNYQVIASNKDSIYQGDSIKFTYGIKNSGGIKVDSVQVNLTIVRPDNSTVVVDSMFISLDTNQIKHLTSWYTNKKFEPYGNYAAQIKVDPNNKIAEIYKDNNLYSIAFKVIKDTTVNVNAAAIKIKFDGKEILDNDFVSAAPKIDIDVNYPIWFNPNISSIKVKVDNVLVDSEKFVADFDTNLRTMNLTYKPALENGEHSITIFTKDAYGKFGETPNLAKYFSTNNELQVLNVYNYPNPFANTTAFTFVLTAIPDEVRVKVFTVAGRLIREITAPINSLKLNTNFVEWDGKDQDGDEIANGVYLYKVLIKKGDKTLSLIKKMAKVK